MDFRVMGLEAPLMSTLHHLMESASPYIPEDDATDAKSSSSANGGGSGSSTRTYVRDARAMASTPVDVKELPSAYVFEVDMPGVRSGEIKVQVEDDNLLVISGERKRGGEEGEKEEGKYLRMERRMGKFMRKFALPENANTEDGVSAACADGVLMVTVKKLPPPEPKKPKTIEVKVA